MVESTIKPIEATTMLCAHTICGYNDLLCPSLLPRFCPNVSELRVAWHPVYNRNELQAPRHQMCQHRGIKYAHCKRMLRPLPLPAPQPQHRLQESSYLKGKSTKKNQGFPMNSLRAATHKKKTSQPSMLPVSASHWLHRRDTKARADREVVTS